MCRLHMQYFGSRVEEKAMRRPADKADRGHPRRCAEVSCRKPRAVGVDLVDVVAVRDVRAHREHDPAAVEIHFRIADHAVGRLEQRSHWPPCARSMRLQRAAGGERAVVVFVLRGWEERGRVVVVGPVLVADDEEKRLAADQRVGQERLALQPDKFSPRKDTLIGRLGGDPGFEGLESREKVVAVGVTATKRGSQVLNRKAQVGHLPRDARHRPEEKQKQQGSHAINHQAQLRAGRGSYQARKRVVSFQAPLSSRGREHGQAQYDALP